MSTQLQSHDNQTTIKRRGGYANHSTPITRQSNDDEGQPHDDNHTTPTTRQQSHDNQTMGRVLQSQDNHHQSHENQMTRRVQFTRQSNDEEGTARQSPAITRESNDKEGTIHTAIKRRGGYSNSHDNQMTRRVPQSHDNHTTIKCRRAATQQHDNQMTRRMATGERQHDNQMMSTTIK